MRNTSRVVLWGAHRNDIQLGGSTDRVTQVTEKLDLLVREEHARKLGELLNPLDIADPGKW